MARYITNQVMFLQQDLSLWGEYNYLTKIRCIFEWDITDRW